MHKSSSVNNMGNPSVGAPGLYGGLVDLNNLGGNNNGNFNSSNAFGGFQNGGGQNNG